MENNNGRLYAQMSCNSAEDSLKDIVVKALKQIEQSSTLTARPITKNPFPASTNREAQ